MVATAAPISRYRRIFWAGLLLGCVVVLGRVLFLKGLVVPIRISGGSMAESLIGDHYDLRCADCGFSFRCGVEGVAPQDAITCPNCGYGKNVVATNDQRPPQRVLIDRWPTFLHAPRRWQVIALRSPEDKNVWSVKRVVGLPGERVSIRHGDIYINDQIATKPRVVQRDLRVPVYDDKYRPRQRSRDLPPRWSSDTTPSRWREETSSHSYSATALYGDASSKIVDELSYHHWRCFANPLPRTDVVPLLDNDPYSPNESRTLHDVTDFRISLKATHSPDAVWSVTLNCGPNRFVFRLNAEEKKCVCEHNDHELANVVFTSHSPVRPNNFIFAFCDGVVSAEVDGREILSASVPNPSVLPMPTTNDKSAADFPCAIGISVGTIHVGRLQIFRDIYYLPPFDLGDRWSRSEPLGENEFFVLGDHPAISLDSRDASFGVVSREAILGEVLTLP